MKNNKFMLAIAVFSMFFLASCAAVFEDVPAETQPVGVGTSTLPTDSTINATTTFADPAQQNDTAAPQTPEATEGTTTPAAGSSTPTLGSTSAAQ